MDRNGKRPKRIAEPSRLYRTQSGNKAPKGAREKRLFEAATELVIEMYTPALKELEKR